MHISKETKIGVMMLDTCFPRLLGDIGNPASFENPVLYKTVEGASPHRVVRQQRPELLQPFIDAGNALIDKGMDVLTTSCGFLIYFQNELQEAFSAPIVTSSLLQFSELENKYGEGSVGIMTISKSSLSDEILAKANIPLSTPIGTTEGGIEFTSAILGNRNNFDIAACEMDNLNAAKELKRNHPNLKALLLECTNMPPHKSAIEKAAGLKVYSIMDALR